MIITWIGCKQSFRRSRWPWNAEPHGGKREGLWFLEVSILIINRHCTVWPQPSSPVQCPPFSMGTLHPAQLWNMFPKSRVITSDVYSQSGAALPQHGDLGHEHFIKSLTVWVMLAKKRSTVRIYVIPKLKKYCRNLLSILDLLLPPVCSPNRGQINWSGT